MKYKKYLKYLWGKSLSKRMMMKMMRKDPKMVWI